MAVDTKYQVEAAPGSHRRLEVGWCWVLGIVVSGRMIQRSQIRRLLFALCGEQSAVSIVKVATKFRGIFTIFASISKNP